MGFFQDLFGEGQAKARKEAAQQQIDATKLGQRYYEGQLDIGREDIGQGYGQAQSAWQPIYDVGRAGSKFYADIAGVNGPEAQAAASSSFQTDPGYQFALSQALQATERTRGTGGFQSSGNVLDALTKTAIGTAYDKGYNPWVSRLAPFLDYSLRGTAGLGGTLTGEADALAASRAAQGQLGYASNVAQGGAQAAGTIGAADARAQGAQQIAKLAAQVGGALLSGGLSGGLGSLGSLGSSLGANLLGAGGSSPFAAGAFLNPGGYGYLPSGSYTGGY